MTQETLQISLGACQFNVHRWWPEEREEEAATPILALHGFTGDGLDFEPVVRLLNEHPWIAPDLVGHGDTLAPLEARDAWSIPSQIAHLEQLLDRLEIERVVLMGYSMGGRIALQMASQEASRARIDKLVLVGATPGIEGEDARLARRVRDGALADSITRDGVAAFLKAWQEKPIIATQRAIAAPHREAMRARRARASGMGWAQSLKSAGTGSMESAWGELERIDVNTLLVTGGDDAKFDAIAARMVKRMPRAACARIEGVGHCAHLEDPIATCEAIARFLRKR